MKWLMIGGVLVGAGVIVAIMVNGPSTPQSGGSNTFGMPLYGGAAGASSAGSYGMAMYGGFHDSNMAPLGYWKPSMLEGQ